MPLSPMKLSPMIQAKLIPGGSMTAKCFAIMFITTFIMTVNTMHGYLPMYTY